MNTIYLYIYEYILYLFNKKNLPFEKFNYNN